MGDRGNIGIRQRDGVVIYFYTHFRGSEVEEILADALHAGITRWDDPAYLARIIFCELLGDSDPRGTTGFGISTSICDNEHPIPIVDCGIAPNRAGHVEVGGLSYSFQMFIQKFRRERIDV